MHGTIHEVRLDLTIAGHQPHARDDSRCCLSSRERGHAVQTVLTSAELGTLLVKHM